MSQTSDTPKTLLIGLSGPSSSGKTTLARLLREIFAVPASPKRSNRSISLTILHEDDFYKTDAQIPVVTTPSGRTLQDWDCAESLDIPRLCSTLEYVTCHGKLPSDFASKEDRNVVTGDHGVSESTIHDLRDQVSAWLATLPLGSSPPSNPTTTDKSSIADITDVPPPPHQRHISLFLLDGFLLYTAPSSSPSSSPSQHPSISHLLPLLPLKLFLRSTAHLTTSRRSARNGYVTLEGFWADPPGYVEEVVWPNYVRNHAWMFESGDCDAGAVRREVVEDVVGVKVGPGFGECGMGRVVEWAVREVLAGVEREVGKERREEK